MIMLGNFVQAHDPVMYSIALPLTTTQWCIDIALPLTTIQWCIALPYPSPQSSDV